MTIKLLKWDMSLCNVRPAKLESRWLHFVRWIFTEVKLDSLRIQGLYNYMGDAKFKINRENILKNSFFFFNFLPFHQIHIFQSSLNRLFIVRKAYIMWLIVIYIFIAWIVSFTLAMTLTIWSILILFFKPKNRSTVIVIFLGSHTGVLSWSRR